MFDLYKIIMNEFEFGNGTTSLNNLDIGLLSLCIVHTKLGYGISMLNLV